jgi:hypothetical protein
LITEPGVGYRLRVDVSEPNAMDPHGADLY